jgi:hypothetical protein
MKHQEIWKDVKGYEGLYKISNFGNVWSVKRKMFRVPSVIGRGYLQVHIFISGKRKCFMVHRLVATHFIDNPENKPQINHIDGDKKNNHYKNLEWCTESENVKHAYSSGLADNKGEKHPGCKLTEDQVKEIRFKREHGARVIDLMEEYGMSMSAIYQITKRTQWTHV